MPLRLGNFSAWISVDDAELPMYNVTTKDAQVSCWIPSEVDKKFSVKLSIEPSMTTISARVYLDGQKVATGVYKAKGRIWRDTISGIRSSTTTEKSFLFSHLELTDDDQYLNNSQPDLGEIRVEFFSSAVIRKGSTPKIYEFSTSSKMHERSKKAIGHHIKLGEESKCKPAKVVKMKDISKLATFSFRYRPLDMLQASGMAPVPPKASQKRPARSDEVLDLTVIDDDEDEDEANERQIKALLEQVDVLRKRKKTKYVKSEPGVKHEGGGKQEPGIKLEGGVGARRNGLPRVVHIGTIDLT